MLYETLNCGRSSSYTWWMWKELNTGLYSIIPILPFTAQWNQNAAVYLEICSLYYFIKVEHKICSGHFRSIATFNPNNYTTKPYWPSIRQWQYVGSAQSDPTTISSRFVVAFYPFIFTTISPPLNFCFRWRYRKLKIEKNNYYEETCAWIDMPWLMAPDLHPVNDEQRHYNKCRQKRCWSNAFVVCWANDKWYIRSRGLQISL